MCRCVYSQPLYNPVIYACIKFQKYFVTDMIEYLLQRISVEAGYPHTIVATCETSLPLPLFRYTPIKAWMLLYHFFSYHYPKWIMKFNLIPFFDNVRFCDEGMVEAVTTLIWAAPRLQSDVQELRVVSPNDLTLGITNYFLVWYYITLMQTCKSKILRYLNLDNMSALSLLIAHFCPEMHDSHENNRFEEILSKWMNFHGFEDFGEFSPF